MALRWVWSLVRVLFRPTIRGLEHLPARGPYLLVANHSAGLGLAELSSFAALYVREVGPEHPMVDAVKAAGAEPIIFLDEPGLYAFSRQQPHHIVMLQQLRINVMALKKRGARVGLHCCSDADWGALIGLGADFVAIDVQLSLPSLLKAGEALVTWVAMGGRLALGVIPTATREAPLTAEQLLADMAQQLGKLEQYFPTRASIFENILLRSLLTPACGLAFLTPADAGAVIDELVRFKGLYGKVKARSWGARR